eukprot:scaffold1350_cov249-Pinguiococcus_pyrenoidosus.AAC.17
MQLVSNRRHRAPPGSSRTCRCGHAGSSTGSSSSGSNSSICGGSERKMFADTHETMSGMRLSVNTFCPTGVFTKSTNSSSVCLLRSFSVLSSFAPPAKLKITEQSSSFCWNSHSRRCTLTSRRAGSALTFNASTFWCARNDDLRRSRFGRATSALGVGLVPAGSAAGAVPLPSTFLSGLRLMLKRFFILPAWGKRIPRDARGSIVSSAIASRRLSEATPAVPSAESLTPPLSSQGAHPRSIRLVRLHSGQVASRVLFPPPEKAFNHPCSRPCGQILTSVRRPCSLTTLPVAS